MTVNNEIAKADAQKAEYEAEYEKRNTTKEFNSLI
jgi:hypothetical protein